MRACVACVHIQVGEGGTPHIQGFITFREKKGLAVVRGLLMGAHVEVTKSTIASERYCKKENRFEVIDNRKRAPSRRNAAGNASLKEDEEEFVIVVNAIVAGMRLQEVVDKYPVCYARHAYGLERLLFRTEQRVRPVPEVIWCAGGTGTGKSRYISESVSDDVYWHSGTYKW